jgi:hypothetical protein
VPTNLLNDDGTASMATMIMSSHHAFRRDAACFAKALAGPSPSRALAQEWKRYREGLHHHHTIEDTAMFPDLRGKHPELGAAIDQLDAHHRAIDPLLDAGDRLFAELETQVPAARDLIATLERLLDEHLEAEERAIIPHMRGDTTFPLPPTDDVIAMYAEGFAWSLAGLAPAVRDQLFVMLPPALVAKIPAARTAFDQRCRDVWGYAHTDTSMTSVPSLGAHPA